jgi:hypothetical protein
MLSGVEHVACRDFRAKALHGVRVLHSGGFDCKATNGHRWRLAVSLRLAKISLASATALGALETFRTWRTQGLRLTRLESHESHELGAAVEDACSGKCGEMAVVSTHTGAGVSSTTPEKLINSRGESCDSTLHSGAWGAYGVLLCVWLATNVERCFAPDGSRACSG